MLNALVIGGTGLISTGIVKHLLARGARVTLYNRGRREHEFPATVQQIAGDRADVSAFVATFAEQRFDVVYDMICFSPAQAEASVRAFSGRCAQFVFCSTVCTYSVATPPGVLIDEAWPLEPVSEYGRNKVLCEQHFQRAAEEGAFQLTIARPSHTYGPGNALIDQQEFDSGTWDRVARGLPVLVAGDGLGLWQSTHRDDCGKFFAYAALAPRTFGQAYNVTRDEVLTWRDYYREVARALDSQAKVIFVPGRWLIAQDPKRFAFLAETTRFHGAYSSAKAKAHVPEFSATIDLEVGARETFADMRKRNAWRDSSTDVAYQQLVERALALGFEVEKL
ncbi:MAG TPA: NAD-dependent epimerase/dehydratase family protein [Polyangiaceae bacterium]|nr:NAD-dependent epimerase/dehydratase family protein [Polyangiaceae bacterium]